LSEDEAMPVQNGKIPNGLFRSNALDESHDATARTAEANARREVLRAKYVVGCDGARSWVRECVCGGPFPRTS
jgi:2-polyprenyl-6-methoxyphenol hydroxylase-like FAD-dependent oxidoreductase